MRGKEIRLCIILNMSIIHECTNMKLRHHIPDPMVWNKSSNQTSEHFQWVLSFCGWGSHTSLAGWVIPMRDKVGIILMVLHVYKNYSREALAAYELLVQIDGMWFDHNRSELQGRSHQYSWSGFNWTTFQDNNYISANIHEFGGVLGRTIGSHVATVDRARDRWLQIVWKQCFLVFQYMKVPREPIQIFFPHFAWNNRHTTPLCCCGQITFHASMLLHNNKTIHKLLELRHEQGAVYILNGHKDGDRPFMDLPVSYLWLER